MVKGMTPEQCFNNQSMLLERNFKPFMEEVRKDIKELNQGQTMLLLEMGKLPDKILEKTDERYAKKDIEKRIVCLEEKNIKEIEETKKTNWYWIDVIIKMISYLVLAYIALRLGLK
jgi:hypothetical protein